MSVYRKENGNMECYGNNSGQNAASDINITDKNGIVTTEGGQTNVQALTNGIEDSLATINSNFANIVSDFSIQNLATKELSKDVRLLIIRRFYNGADKKAIVCRDFSNTVGYIINTFASGELTITYSDSKWTIVNGINGVINCTAIGII